MPKLLNECLVTEPISEEESNAIRAVASGEANPGQQTMAIAVIVKKLSRVYDLAYFPGRPDEGAFMAGRQLVGLNITKIINNKGK